MDEEKIEENIKEKVYVDIFDYLFNELNKYISLELDNEGDIDFMLNHLRKSTELLDTLNRYKNSIHHDDIPLTTLVQFIESIGLISHREEIVIKEIIDSYYYNLNGHLY